MAVGVTDMMAFIVDVVALVAVNEASVAPDPAESPILGYPVQLYVVLGIPLNETAVVAPPPQTVWVEGAMATVGVGLTTMLKVCEEP